MSKVLPIVQGSAQQPDLRIGDIARLTEKTTRAVRLYEELGLLGSVFRTEGGHRVYTKDVLTRIAWIDKLQVLGFSLNQIKELVKEWGGSEFGPEAMTKLREIFEQKLEETRSQIKTLEALAFELNDSLRYLQSCTTCDPATLLGVCKSCEEPHVTQCAPDLVSGVYSARNDS